MTDKHWQPARTSCLHLNGHVLSLLLHMPTILSGKTTGRQLIVCRNAAGELEATVELLLIHGGLHTAADPNKSTAATATAGKSVVTIAP